MRAGEQVRFPSGVGTVGGGFGYGAGVGQTLGRFSCRIGTVRVSFSSAVPLCAARAAAFAAGMRGGVCTATVLALFQQEWVRYFRKMRNSSKPTRSVHDE